MASSENQGLDYFAPGDGFGNSMSFHIAQIRLEERLVDIDIAADVQYRLGNSTIPEEHRSVIVEAVPGRTNGLFLYAKL